MNKEWLPDILAAVYKATDAILEVYAQDFEVTFKEDESPVTIADKRSNRILVDALEKTGVLVISEEEIQPTFKERKGKDVWLVDPLDGTKEFIKKNDEFCICIALIINEVSVFGLIASPTKKEIIFGGANIEPALIKYGEQNIFAEQFRIDPIKQNEFTHITHSRTHVTPKIDAFIEKQEELYGKIERIKKGSALKFFDLTHNKAQLYVRLWPTMEWDIAAGQAIYEALGGEVVHFTNFTPLRYNKEDLRNPSFIAKPKNLNLI